MRLRATKGSAPHSSDRNVLMESLRLASDDRLPDRVRIHKTQGEYKESASPSIADMIADIDF